MGNVIVETDTVIISFIQPLNKTLIAFDSLLMG